MILLFVYLFIALFISFLCSILESVLLSIPITYLKAQEENGNNKYTRMINMKENVDRPLSAILSLNTVAHTVGAAGVGAQATLVFGEAYFGIVSAILTVLILVITEIIPKTLGARYWKNLIPFTTKVLRVIIFISYPVVIVLGWIARLFANPSEENTTSREEIAALANIGTSEGIFGKNENKIIQNLIQLKTIKASKIMTPRVVVEVANEKMNAVAFLRDKNYSRFSRIPVFDGDDENITGYVVRQNIYDELSEENETSLELHEMARKIIIVPSNQPVFSLFEKLIQAKEHIAVVVDEYGGMDGIVTMEDIIETLLGLEIVDEKDHVTDMQQFARQKWKLKQKNNMNYNSDEPQEDSSDDK